MTDNLPTGCTENDIPGNGPEDVEWEAMVDWLSEIGLTPVEIRRRVGSPYWNRGKKIPGSKRMWP